MLSNIDSYIYGLLVTDGSLSLNTQNRGKVTIELNIKDEDIIHKLYEHIPGSKIKYRERKTNFTNGQLYKSVIFANYLLEYRTSLINQGFPIENKTMNAAPPIVEYSEIDFWRGVIDGDGSLGITGVNERPYICLGTKSEYLKDAYLLFLNKHFGITKNLNRNKRDNIYNIMLNCSNAVKVSRLLYGNNPEIYLNRKYNKYLEIEEFNKKYYSNIQ